jgi:hypothetical protein
VYVQYGTKCSEDLFPAAIHLQNLDGTHQITYQDLVSHTEKKRKDGGVPLTAIDPS